MAIASVELQKAIYTALKSGSYSVYEVVPPNTTMPYIVIGEEILTHNNTKTEIRTVHNITIHTWSKGSSSAESKAMNDFVIKKLLAGFVVSGFYLDRISLEMMTTFKEINTDTIFHGVNQFEITITN
jgi:hypothetical protein